MSEPFIGEIRMVGFNFAPRGGWMLCNGQLLAIASNTALFSLLGTTYGGNGTTTFALPDLRGRVPLHQGQGPGLSDYVMGEASGSETVTLINSQMPMHNHALTANSDAGGASTSTNNFIASPSDPSTGAAAPSFAQSTNTVMNPQSIGISGGNQPHQNMQPFLCVNFIIATQGIFPSRN